MSTTIAIDPGKSGGVVVKLHGDVVAHKMPETVRDLFDLVDETVREHYRDDIGDPVCVIEDVPPFAGKAQSGSSAFKLGKNVGHCEAVATAKGCKIVKVRPQKWQKDLGLGTRGNMTSTQWKNKLKGRAQELFPNLKLTLATADAALLLEWYERNGA